MSRLGNTKNSIEDEWRMLNRQWEAAQANWKDKKMAAFEREYREPTERQTVATLEALAKLAEEVARAKRQLEQRHHTR